ncbi:MAG: winged helix DNA-binding domain-containing protein, partial [Actinomycetota bacterium]|nr:winged helix DNA-binding domain-containing protein [Actinomycetota bacterium]
YLEGHGPADAADLARWAGIPLGDARRGLAGISSDVVKFPGGLVDLADRDPPAALPAPLLLGPFDPVLLGWVSREPFVGQHQVVTSNGIFRPFAMVDGRVIATWRLGGNTITVRLLEPVAPGAVAALEREATDILQFLGRPAGGGATFVD